MHVTNKKNCLCILARSTFFQMSILKFPPSSSAHGSLRLPANINQTCRSLQTRFLTGLIITTS